MIECVPNVSAAANPVVGRFGEVLSEVEGVRLLDFSSDESHNRSVFTFVGDERSLERAVIAMYELAVSEIDLRVHRGEHPRIGAVDVVPFVPLGRTTMAEAVVLARRVGQAIADRFSVPVFLYEEAANNPRRRKLEDIRRGQFESLAIKMANADWAPDFGPPTPHPTAGASAVGAREALIAYNVNLRTDRLAVAKAVASAIRQSSGGLPSVKALGLCLHDRGIVQVTTNLTNYHQTSIEQVFEAVEREAARFGVEVLESEIIGLVPAAALPPDPGKRLKLRQFSDRRILEVRLGEIGLYPIP